MDCDIWNKYKNFIFFIVVCYKGFLEVIEGFFEKGFINVNCMDKNGSMLFVLVCRFVFIFDCKYLIEKGVKLCSIIGNGVILFIVVVMR